MNKKITVVTGILMLLITSFSFAQDTAELEAENAANAKLKGINPIPTLMKTLNTSLKKELVGVHPRVFLTQSEIDALKDKTKSQSELWQVAISTVRAMTVEATPAPAQERRVQNQTGLGIAEAALAY